MVRPGLAQQLDRIFTLRLAVTAPIIGWESPAMAAARSVPAGSGILVEIHSCGDVHQRAFSNCSDLAGVLAESVEVTQVRTISNIIFPN